mgnify:CR=1 FL=1
MHQHVPPSRARSCAHIAQPRYHPCGQVSDFSRASGHRRSPTVLNMSHATAQKRKAHAALDGLSGSKTSGKKPRVSERGEDSDDDNDDDDDDDDDVDEYIPGSSRSSRGIAASSGSRSKTAKPKIRSAKATKIMSVHESGPSSSHATPPLADRKGPHGRPLSREQLRKANHSLIERRRREKMNKAFADLRAMVPGLSTESEGLKGEFKLEVRSVAIFESHCSLHGFKKGTGEIRGTHETPHAVAVGFKEQHLGFRTDPILR